MIFWNKTVYPTDDYTRYRQYLPGGFAYPLWRIKV